MSWEDDASLISTPYWFYLVKDMDRNLNLLASQSYILIFIGTHFFIFFLANIQLPILLYKSLIYNFFTNQNI